MSFRTTFFFRAGQYGWSEAWYVPGATSLDNAQARSISLAATRSAMLGAGSYMFAIRTWDDAVRNSTIWKNVEPRPLPPVDPRLIRNTPWFALKWRVDDTSLLYKRYIFLRGVADAITTRNGEGVLELQPLIIRAMERFTATLKSLGFGWKALNQGANGQVVIPVTALAVEAGTGAVIVTAAGHGLRTGQQVRIYQVVGTGLRQRKPLRGGVNGIHYIRVLTGDTFAIPVTSSTLTGPPVWRSGGLVRTRNRLIVTAQSPAVFQAVSRRKTGASRYNIAGRARPAPARM